MDPQDKIPHVCYRQSLHHTHLTMYVSVLRTYPLIKVLS